MTGDREIIAMRRAGKKPSTVWVQDFAKVTLDGYTVKVWGDTPELLDFRFLVGVCVILESESEYRLLRLMKAIQAHASRVIAVLSADLRPTKIIDTEGHLTWQA